MNSHKLILEIHESIQFFEEEHIYLLDNKVLTSGTKFISQFHKPFNKEEILNKVSKGDEVRKARLNYEWSESSPWGTYIHRLLELHYSNYEVQLNKGSEEEQQFEKGVSLVEEILVSGNIEIVGLEVRVTNCEICGTIDLLLFNKDTQKYILCDFKTCKSIPLNSFNGEKLKTPLDNIDDCKFEKYSLQLSLYGAMLENYSKQIENENLNIEVESCYILHIPKIGNGTIKRASNYKEILKEIIN